MRSPRVSLLSAVLLLLVLIYPASANPLIKLQAITINPTAVLTDAAIAINPGTPAYLLVQCSGPVQPEWRNAIENTGSSIMGYVPDYAFLVRTHPQAETALRSLPFVRWIGTYQPSYKYNSGLAYKPDDKPLIMTVVLFRNENTSSAAGQMAKAGVSILTESSTGEIPFLRVQALPSALPSIASINAVQWIEEYIEPELLNDISRGIMKVNQSWTDLGLYGAGQKVAVCDTGLDTGSLTSISQDFMGRVAAVHALGRTNDWSDSHAHGTHVAGSVLGSGKLSGSDPGVHHYTGSFAGVAPEAQLVMQSVMDSSGGLGGLPADLNSLFQQAYDDGARIHTNSWGARVYGEYTFDSYNTDLFSWNHKDFLILFAAGNSGADRNMDGVVDADSINSPGTAKNCVTVGAVENLRFSDEFRYGAAWPADYPADPLRNDLVSDNAWGMAAFSSRGPTDDGRRKPDLCAQGTNVVSARSHHPGAGVLWGVYDTHYTYSGGTSMSCPLTAGAAALVRQYFQTVKGWESVSSAMIKAALINGAVDMYPGQYGVGAFQEVSGRPDKAQGWGRVDVGSIVLDNGQVRDFKENNNGIVTGQSVPYTYSVPAGSTVRFTLVYTDYPATLGLAIQLVNDLDLIVTDPNSNRFYPNRLIGPDRLNPVEDLQISNAIGGTYSVSVAGFNVPNGPQPYALVVRIIPGPPDLSASEITVSPARTVYTGQTLTYRIAVRNLYSMQATGVRITNTPPSGTTYISGSTTLNGVPIADNAGQCPLIPGLFINSPGAPSGQVDFEAVVAYNVTVNADLPSGTITNSVLISADGGVSITRTVTSITRVSRIIRVKPGGTGDGSSWAEAMGSVVLAANAALAGDEIWAAAGTYVGCVTLKEDVALYGGFAGTEANRDQRNWTTNITILDGGQVGSVINVTNSVGSLTRVDGFTIRNGRSTTGGGGIHCSYANLFVANNRITANTDTGSSYGGGGIYLSKSDATLFNNVIENNTAVSGAGIYCSASSPIILNNTIRNNSGSGSGNYGGGIYCYGYSSPLIANNLITGNSLVAYGAGIACNNYSNPSILNNTVSENTASISGGGIYLLTTTSPKIVNNIIAFNSSGLYRPVAPNTVMLRNNCVYSNGALNYSGLTAGPGDFALDPLFVNRTGGDFHLQPASPCLDRGDDTQVLGNWTDMDGHPRIFGQHVDVGADEVNSVSGKLPSPVFTPDGGIYTSSQSVVITCSVPGAVIHYTTGTADPKETDPIVTGPIAVTANVTIKARAWKTGWTASDVKTAAYTIRSPARIYVNKSSPGPAHDGLTWATAFQTVQAALNAGIPGDEVWVAANTYVESIILKEGVSLYGGFAGTETSRNQRNWTTNRTILDANKTNSVVIAPIGITTATAIDGFIIRNGKVSNGAGIACTAASPTIVNNTITGNIALSAGGGIYCHTSSPIIANNLIIANTAYTCGAGITVSEYSYPTIANNTIVHNNGYGNPDNGYGIQGLACTMSSMPTIVNNIIAYNVGGVYASYPVEGAISFRNNCVYGNTRNYYGMVDRTGTDGNISTDPKLPLAAFGNMHIQPDSPCRDAGDSSIVAAAWTDLDGTARIQGAAVDIGADESNGTAWLSQPPVVIRVKTTGNDANDGSSWTSAKRTIQSALDSAAVSGGEVWVASGIYNQRITLRPYVYLYGGFNGSETVKTARNWTTFSTVIDGGAGGSAVTSDHAGYRVSTVDGFTIRNGSSSNGGGGVYCYYSSPIIANNIISGNKSTSTTNGGGGIYCLYASVAQIIGNTIIRNTSSSSGGGIDCYASSHPDITSNLITGNSAKYGAGIAFRNLAPSIVNGNSIRDNTANAAGGAGGAIYIFKASPEIRGNRISGNRAAYKGGGVYFESSDTNPLIIGNLVAGNAAVWGGGIHAGASVSGQVSNNTIVGNSSSSGTAGVECNSVTEVDIGNNLIAFNSSGVGKLGTGTVNLMNNCVYQNGMANYNSIAPGATDFSDKDPRLADPAHGNLHIQPDSPCRDAGNDTLAGQNDMDIDAQVRIQGAHIDIGADESDGTTWASSPFVVRVRMSGSDTLDGSTWAAAKKTIQAAVDTVKTAGGGQVWVAAGVYNECVVVPPFVHLYGGFSELEARLDQRNWAANLTILDGQSGGSVVTLLPGYKLSTISGFTIQKGQSLSGGGISCMSASPTICNNVIRQNSAYGTGSAGGGIYCNESFASIISNVIVSNSSTTSGGGILVNNSTPLIANNTIVGNTAGSTAGGAGIYSNNSRSSIANNIVASNSSGIKGGTNDTLRNNCVFSNGTVNYEGLTAGPGDISVDPLLRNVTGGDYHLASAASPCVDAGYDTVVEPSWLDMDVQKRVFSSHVDIGSDEYTVASQMYTTTGGFVKGGRWNCVSIPADPVNANPLVVFSAIDVQSASFQFWKNSSEQGGYQSYGEMFGWTGPVVRGIPYWFLESSVTADKEISYEGYPAIADFELAVSSHTTAPFWIMLGTPYPVDVPCAGVTFTNTAVSTTPKPWVDAFNAGMVESKALGFDTAAGQFFTAGDTSFSPQRTILQPWYGYWLLVNRSEPLTITFPLP